MPLIFHHAGVHTHVEISFFLLLMDLLRHLIIDKIRVCSKNQVVHLSLSEEFWFLRILGFIDEHRWLDLNLMNFLVSDLSSSRP